MWSVCIKIAQIENKIWKITICEHSFVVYMLIYPLSKFGGSQTISLWILALYSVCFKQKNALEKTPLNVSIRWVIFTTGQNVKPPFLCKYLIFFSDLRLFSLYPSLFLEWWEWETTGTSQMCNGVLKNLRAILENWIYWMWSICCWVLKPVASDLDTLS